jgi:excisionase family DNA binding protein
MAMTTEIAGYLSIPEAANVLGVSDSLVRRWVRNGTLPHLKIGDKVRIIPRRTVEKFAAIPRRPGPKSGG